MASFCEWTVQQPSDDPNVVKLAETVGNGLKFGGLDAFEDAIPDETPSSSSATCSRPASWPLPFLPRSMRYCLKRDSG